MPLNRIETRRLISPADLEPSSPTMKIVSVFNPGVAEVDGRVVIVARIAEAPAEARPGYVGLPRWTCEDPANPPQIEIDWVAEQAIAVVDPRVVRIRSTDLIRLTFTSHLRVIDAGDGLNVTAEQLTNAQSILPAGPTETFGIEDPRITRIDDTCYMTYVAVSAHGPCTALMQSTDLRTFQRRGIILPVENKDVVLFPERIDGRYVAIHRPVGHAPFTRPEMWIADSPDLLNWGNHAPLMGGGTEADSSWSIGRIGAGAPPIRTDAGWLEIYHGNSKAPGSDESDVGTYVGGAILLDLQNPRRIIARTTEPIMAPEADFETTGFVDRVVFPTAVLERDDAYLVYYGAADESIGVVRWSKRDVMNALVPVT